MTAPPLVSICIPTYNAAEFLAPSLDSALAQTYPHLEILISDDGSTDDTLAIVGRFQQKHPHIRLVRNEAKGMVNNWNNCISQAKGEWVKLLFQDDLLQPACVEKMVNACVANGVDVGLCRRRFIIHDDVPRSVRRVFRFKLIMPERVFDEADFIGPEALAKGVAEHLPENVLGEPVCYLFNKRIFAHTGLFNPEYKQVVDLEFILRLGLQKGLAFLPEALVFFRVHGRSESSANTADDKEAQARNVAAVTGDTMLLFHQFLHNPAFALVKEAAGADVLRLRIKYLYYSACKHKGQSIVNRALAPIRKKYKELGLLRYSFFNYVRYRKRYRKWEKENRW